MDNQRVQASEVLTEDEKMVADFVKTRLKKVLGDIQALAESKSEDLRAWSECFTYLSRTYGHDSEETYRWFKYYFREKTLPDAVALPILLQIYFDSVVDNSFVNMLARAMKAEPEDLKNARIAHMQKELAEWLDEDGRLIAYRGCFEKPFGRENDASKPIEKAWAFTMDEAIAKQYACGWYPEKATVYKAAVDLADIALANCYDEEKTVILLPQSKGGTWQITTENVIAESDYDMKIDRKKAALAYSAAFKR